MPKQVRNILVGVGEFYVSSPLDPATLEPDTATPGAGFTNPPTNAAWRNIGFTIDGLEVTFEPDLVDITVDQLGDAAKLVEQSTKVMLKTTMAEATLTNLAYAWGYDESGAGANSAGLWNDTDDQVFNIGVFATAIPTERALYFVGKGPGGVTRTYTCWRVVSVASSGHSYKRGEATVFPVEFRVLPQSSRTGNEYGVIRDIGVNTIGAL